MRITSTILSVAVLLGVGLRAASATDLVVNGDFSAGNTGFTTAYLLTTMTPDLFQNGVHGIYAVIPIGTVNGQAAYGDWNNVTTDPSGGNGNVLVADGATTPNTIVWQETVNVTPNTNYVFSYYAAEISNACCSNGVFVPTINGSSGSGQTLGGSWQQYTFTWNSGLNTTATLSLTDTNTSDGFNDFVLTDISFGSEVPEPSTWAMLLPGLAGISFAGYRRTRRSTATAA